MTYAIEFTKSAQKEVKKLDPVTRKRVLAAINRLAHNPRVGKTRQMVGSKSWRMRVGAYRVVYDINDGKLTVLILKAKHRSKVYE